MSWHRIHSVIDDDLITDPKECRIAAMLGDWHRIEMTNGVVMVVSVMNGKEHFIKYEVPDASTSTAR